MSKVCYNEVSSHSPSSGELSDTMVDTILKQYHRKQLLQSLIGPGLSFSLHVVMFTVAATCVMLPPPKPESFQISCIEVPHCVFDDEEIILEEDVIEQEIEELSDLPTTDPAIPNDLPSLSETPEDSPVEAPSDHAPDVSDCAITQSPLFYYTGRSSHSGGTGVGGGIACYRSRCGCGRRLVAKYGSKSSPRVQQKVLAPALNWLARVQNPNGSWGTGTGWGPGEGHPAHTGLATLVFLAQGKTPLSPLYGPTVQKALRWLAAYGSQDGLSDVVRKRHGAYAHGIATYAIAEGYGLTGILHLKNIMDSCLNVLIDGQMAEGGFGYSYTSGPRWDMSVTGWNVQALKAADLAGSTSPRLAPAMTKSVDFLHRVAYSGKGQFGYAGTSPAPRSNMAGIAVLCLQLLGDTTSQQVRKGYDTIYETRLPDYQRAGNEPETWNARAGASLYGWYYDTQVMFNSQGTRAGKVRWNTWRNTFERALEKSQNKEGYWETNGKHTIGTSTTEGRVLATCLCALQLEVFYRRLPTYAGHRITRKHPIDKQRNAVMIIDNTELVLD